MAEDLALRKKFITHASSVWHEFLKRRNDRLKQQNRPGGGAEKIVENILEDLFIIVLQWPLSDINHQIGGADLIFTSCGIKQLVIEAKRPNSLTWKTPAIERALNQVRTYADEQKIKRIGICDGNLLYIADIKQGILKDRLFISLDELNFPESLWYLTIHGIYRIRENNKKESKLFNKPKIDFEPITENIVEVLLHPKYKLPVNCFAYAGHANNPNTWKLPYLLANGEIDVKRLPKAIQAILSNYRGTKVTGIPEPAIPHILNKLAKAAKALGKLPAQSNNSAPIYVELVTALEQFKQEIGV